MNKETPNLDESLEAENLLKEDINNLQEAPSATTTDVPTFGWSNYAERINGRFAMIGFIFILLIELFSNKAFLIWAGLIG